jgi:ribonucleoside-diphosphate reductase alpha chain
MGKTRNIAPDADGTYRAAAHPVIGEALMRLNYPTAAITATQAHIVGSSTLRKAPALNPAALRARGLTDTAIEKIESYLPCVSSLRLAVTPWIVGMDFCRDELNVSSAMLDAPFFDLLKHLGYSDAEITAADLADLKDFTRAAQALGRAIEARETREQQVLE